VHLRIFVLLWCIMKHLQQTGWNAFRTIWASQALSLLGTGMTRFAVLIWAYQQEGSATALALLGFFSCLTYILASPFAGVLVDRWDRRKVMFLADLGAGLMTTLLLALSYTGRLHVWHLYLAEGIVGAFEAFQDPAFSAAVSLLVPKTAYTRSNAMLGLGKSAARVLAPTLGGLLLQSTGLNMVMLVDLVTMSLALLSLVFVQVPKPPPSSEGLQAAGSFWRQMRFGFGYIWRWPGLRNLLFTFFLINLFGTLTYFAVHSPMILSRTGGDELVLGTVRTMMGIGGIAGGLIISIWGTPRRKTTTYLVSTSLSFAVCDFMTAVSRSVTTWSIAGFISELTIPFIISPYYALWQEVVPPDVQGRVFSTREMIQVSSQPVGYLLGGVLADRLFEPALLGGTDFARILGALVGNGPGSGMSAMFLCTAVLGGAIGFLGLLSPSIRGLETAKTHDA
jgi:MFS transporter, DHA3 family, macrolide efflux protein